MGGGGVDVDVPEGDKTRHGDAIRWPVWDFMHRWFESELKGSEERKIVSGCVHLEIVTYEAATEPQPSLARGASSCRKALTSARLGQTVLRRTVTVLCSLNNFLLPNNELIRHSVLLIILNRDISYSPTASSSHTHGGHTPQRMASRAAVGNRPGARFAQFKLVLLGTILLQHQALSLLESLT